MAIQVRNRNKIKKRVAYEAYKSGKYSKVKITKKCNISRVTLNAWIKKENWDNSPLDTIEEEVIQKAAVKIAEETVFTQPDKISKPAIEAAKVDVLASYASGYVENVTELNEAIKSTLILSVDEVARLREKADKEKADFDMKSLLVVARVFNDLQRGYKTTAEALKTNFEGIRLALGIKDEESLNIKMGLLMINKSGSSEEFSAMVNESQPANT